MEQLRLFIAEDEAIILSNFKMQCQRLGHAVIGVARDGDSAEREILRLHPDLVLIDINMPGKNGIEVVEHVMQEELIPCVFITGFYSEDLSAQAARAGAFGYLLKPVDNKQISVAIQIAQARYQEFTQIRQESDTLRTALEDRKYIERAKGILMSRFALSEPEAMKRLQKLSKDRNKKMAVISRELIAAEKLLDL